VTITHRYGTTEITERPARIVSLDTQWTDVLIALDALPVGYLTDPNVDGDFPWRGDMLAATAGIEAANTLPYEQIAALRPDLIVITFMAPDEAAYRTLAAIAPTIGTLGDAAVDPWPDIVAAAGQALGEPDAAAALTDQVQADVAALADDLPGLEGRTFTFANVVPGDGIYVLTDPADGANQLFGQLGMVVAPEVAAIGDGADGGRVQLGFEQAGLLDADLMVLLTNGADPATVIPGFTDFAAVQRGAVSVLSYEDIVGLNTPSPLSVPYSLEKIRPALEAAAS
jgi:iron complex transport system substrate-binding protein